MIDYDAWDADNLATVMQLYCEGEQAAKVGKRISDCPYSYGSMFWGYWCDGFDKERERMK